MNTSQGALYFGAGIDTAQFRRDIDSMRRDILGLTQTTVSETRQMDSAFKNLSLGIAGYFSVGAIKGFVTELINVRGEFQKTEIAFSTMLGSADKARVLMEQMVDLAAKTPFGLQEVSAGAKQLLAFQIPANEVVDVLTRMGNIAAGLGVPLSRINLVYGQVKAKGKLMGDDLRQFTEAGIPMVAELAKKFNKTTSEITEMVSAGKIGFKDVQDVLFAMTNEGGMFFNLMEKQSASLSGRIANLGDTWDQMLNKIGESSEGFLYDAIEGANFLVENYQKIIDILESLVVVYGSYKAAIIVTAAAQNFANKTVQSEIALLSISEKMKLGRAMVTQRQAEATARDTAAEVQNIRAKYQSLQTDVSALAIKKRLALQSAIAASAKAQEARMQLSLARMELASMQATGTAREIEIAQKRVAAAQNTMIATQEAASIARKKGLAAVTEFNASRQQLENTAKTLSVATNTAATAAENAQTAAKTANSIATARLTLMTTLRTSATRLATAAQALLNATMLDNPIVIVIAAAAALTYAYFRLRDTSTALSIAEKALNDEREKSRKLIEDIKNKTQELTAVINSDTSTKLQQLEAYKQMQAMYPSLLKEMDLEVYKKLGATEAQKKLNAELDKFSTQNIKNQINNSKKNIEELTARVDELNKMLQKRNGDSGIQLTQLEFAKKNLEAQRINLEKYNEELSQRLENEKISTMNLAEQKKYWQDQVSSINKEISALEKSNVKKAEGLDKILQTSALVKTTALDFINWNINPLLSQLSRAQSEINKINNAQSEKGVSKNKQYWEDQKKAASEANDAMDIKLSGSNAWNENKRKYKEAEEQLKKFDYTDKQLLKDQKERERERLHLEKGAEKSYLQGSITRYEQKISLLEEALKRSAGDNVRMRYVDKYGKEKYSNEVRSVKSIQDEILALREQRAEREKLIAVKSFQEQTDEAERQWNNYYKMSEFYGKKAADEQYKGLFNGVQSYMEYLWTQLNVLEEKRDKGGILTDQEKSDMIFLQDKMKNLNGNETPLENFKRSIENTLKSLPSLVDQLNYIEDASEEARKKGVSNSPDSLNQKKYLNEQKRNILQQQKDLYNTFLNEEASFQQKKTVIQQKWDKIRADITASSMSDEDKKSYTSTANKNEAKEISSASFEAFKKTDLWVKAFGDLEKMGPRTLAKLKKGLESYLSTNGSNLKSEELKTTQDQIQKLRDLISSNDPFTAIGVAIDNYNQKRKELNDIEKKSSKSTDEYKFKLEETEQSFLGIIDVTGQAANAMINAVTGIGDALGGLSGDMKETLADVQQLLSGIVSTVTGYIKKNYVQMVSGIVQMAGAITKMLNGDDDKSFTIRSWERSVNDLKTAYENLNRELSKTAGSAQFDKQRELVANLEAQKAAVASMLKLEKEKKKPDAAKVNEYQNQIAQINGQIEDLIDNLTSSIAGTDFKSLANQLADALTESFGKGEDAALAYEKVVEDVMRNAVKNALKIAILEPATKAITEKLVSSLGYGTGNNAAMAKQIADAEALLLSYQKESEQLFVSGNQQSYRFKELALLIKDLKAKIDVLKTQAITDQGAGVFDGLTVEEREKIKAMGEEAMKKYMEALKQYQDLFGESAENAQGLKGDIKGITEKTAGALEGQFNAVRINIAAVLKIMQGNQTVSNAQTALLSQIEVNTRRLHNMDKTLSEMNSKIKPGLAGIP